MRLPGIICTQRILLRHEGASTRVTPLYETAGQSSVHNHNYNYYIPSQTKSSSELGRNIDVQA